MIPPMIMMMIWGTMILTGPSSPFFWGGEAGASSGHETVST